MKTVSYDVTVPLGAAIYSLVFGEDSGSTDLTYLGNSNIYSVAPTPGYSFAGRFQTYSGTQAFTFYIDENLSLSAGGAYGSPTNDYLSAFRFSGYLVDK